MTDSRPVSRLPLVPTARRGRRVAPVAVAVAGLFVVALAVGACGGDGGGDAERAALTDSLEFLRTDYGLDASQVRCVVAEVERQVGAAELDELAAEMREVAAGRLSLDQLEGDRTEVVTGSLTTCAAVSEP